MKPSHPLAALAVLFSLVLTSPAAPAAAAISDDTRARVAAAYGKLPLSFERNEGQTAAEVAYLSRGRGTTLFLTPSEAVLALRGSRKDAKRAVLRLRMVGANTAPAIAAEEPLQGTVNYFRGNDRSRWRTGVRTFRRIRYDEVWPGIDLVWHGTQSALEYDFIVDPGVDPSRIRLRVDGAKRLRLDDGGNLIAETAAGDVIQHAPVLYQESAAGRTPVRGTYVLHGKKEIGFDVGAYDRTRALIIDPVLEYSTFLGRTSFDEAFAIGVDDQGQAYVTGPTQEANDFPPKGPFDAENAKDGFLIFITKLNPLGSDTSYTALLSGADGTRCFDDTYCGLIATGIAVMRDGRAAITGSVDNSTNSSTYPVTENAFQDNGRSCSTFCPVRGRRSLDAFVTMLSADGETILYSTFYGGSAATDDKHDDIGEAIAIDANARIYITGRTSSDDLPTKNAFQFSRRSSGEKTDAFVAVFDPFESRGNKTLLYASYLGGNRDDVGRGIAVDPDRNAYVVGSTSSTNLQTRSPAGQSLPPLQGDFQGGGFDGFVSKIDTEASGNDSLTYLSYFGGAINDRVEGVAVDSLQRAYITGATSSDPASFPLVNAFDSTQRNGEAFVAKLNADGTALFYCSFLGGDNGNTAADFEEGMAITIDALGSAYVTGNTTSRDSFPTSVFAPPFPPEQRGTAFVAKIGPGVSATATPVLLFSSTFGGEGTKTRGIALNPADDPYIAGVSFGELPATDGAFQTKFGGASDAFVSKIGDLPDGAPDTTGLYDSVRNEFLLRNSNSTGGPDLVVPLGQPGDLPVAGDWDADDVTDVGVFRPETGQFFLRLRIDGQLEIVTVSFPGGKADLPVAGDWDGDGFDTVGVFRNGGRTGQQFLLTNARATENQFPDSEIVFSAGEAGDLPLAGDWNGDGRDTIGLFRPSTSAFIQMDDLSATAVRSFPFGIAGDLPLAGDWDGDARDDVAVFRPSDRTMHLTTDFGVTAGIVFEFQTAKGAHSPVAGDWDGR
ncbi:MAG TPA: SBBP repeat-containing protein [Thermoanaerobaculia bacterium]|nr:SBBP repeat-containing protein [Thermoanaerobaculia bacterium]